MESSDYTVIDHDGNGTAEVHLDGTGSFDADGKLLTHVWETNGVPAARGDIANITLPLGVHPVTLRVTDSDALFAEDILTIRVVTNRPGGMPGSPTAVIDTNFVFSSSTFTSSVLLSATGFFSLIFDHPSRSKFCLYFCVF